MKKTTGEIVSGILKAVVLVAVGGCIGGAGCLTHGEKNKAEVDKYGKEAYEKTITDALSQLGKID